MAASVPVYHPSLVRQLRRLRVVNSQPDSLQLSTLLRQVSDSYAEADDGRYTLERSIEISSNEMRALHDVLSRQASQDALTGLPNRAAFTELLSGALARRRSSRTDVAVLFIDLDGFKAVNDTLGHSSGDEVLVRTGERIRSAVRENDVVSRLGGDEFVVLCPDIDSIDTAVSVARRIAAQLESPYHLGVQDTTISASIGIAMAVPGVTNADEMVRRADIAMYEAKSGRRGQFLVFDEEMRLRVDGRRCTENALRTAISDDEFVLHYQPVVRLSDHSLLGMEALVRWQRPGHGLVAPDTFVKVAEQARLISAIDSWVVTEACRVGAAWPHPTATVAVNLSGRDLEHEDMLTVVSQALQRSGLSPRRLVVELTETVLMSENAAIPRNLARIQALGVQLAIDDFGTGYSSLSYLRQLPASILKIDQSFVAAIEADDAATAIVGAVVTMAHALKLSVIAEGVERPCQAEQLRLLGCDAAQGYLFARPQPANELDSYFDAGQAARWAAIMSPTDPTPGPGGRYTEHGHSVGAGGAYPRLCQPDGPGTAG